MNCSTPGFPVLHYLLEFAQKHVHWISDAIQPSHPLLPPFPPALNPFQHQGLFQTLCIRWPKYWSFSFKHQSFQWIFRTDFLSDCLVWSPCCPRNSQESSGTTIQKHQFFDTQPSLWSNSYICTWLLENHSFDYMNLCQQSDVSAF